MWLHLVLAVVTVPTDIHRLAGGLATVGARNLVCLRETLRLSNAGTLLLRPWALLPALEGSRELCLLLIRELAALAVAAVNRHPSLDASGDVGTTLSRESPGPTTQLCLLIFSPLGAKLGIATALGSGPCIVLLRIDRRDFAEEVLGNLQRFLTGRQDA